MVALIDIVPLKRTVQIADGEVPLRALSLRQIADLFLRFPPLQQRLTPGAPPVDPSLLIVSMPDAVGAIIAEAAGQPEAAENIATNMSTEDVAECLIAVLEITAPRGLGPLLDRLANLFGTQFAGIPGKVPATNSQRPPRNSLRQDTHAET
jgi:hypothetical protein